MSELTLYICNVCGSPVGSCIQYPALYTKIEGTWWERGELHICLNCCKEIAQEVEELEAMDREGKD